MEKIEVIRQGSLLELPTSSLTIVIAINGNRKSKYIINWALEKFVPEGKFTFKLLHVRPKITAVPTPMGNSIPLWQVRDDVVDAYKMDVELQTREKLLPYVNMFAQKKVKVETLQIESDDVADAISGEVAKHTINKLVIGASSRGLFSRGQNLSSQISASTPEFCTVYVVSKGKLSSLRPSDSETNGSLKDGSSETSWCTDNSSSQISSSQTEWTDSQSANQYSHSRSPSLPLPQSNVLPAVNQNFIHKGSDSDEGKHFRSLSADTAEIEDFASTCSKILDFDYGSSHITSFRSLASDNQSWTSDQASISGATTDFSGNQIDINFELDKLRIELRHIRGMYAIAQSEAIDASRKLSDLHKRRLEEAIKLKEISFKEEEAKELATQEKRKYEEAKREANRANESAEREAAQRIAAENRAMSEAQEKEKLESALVGPVLQYQNFTWEEIVSGTESFSDSLKIGMGAYGTVYKCCLHHTVAAVKVLHSTEAHRTKEFQLEIEILSKIRHPHLLILLGVCPDRSCLVYEYMENGNLEERLLRKNNTPPIPWFDRYRIAWEVASALAFLHYSKPRPIIHRDLKPANILLDHNFVSKIGDVGLSTMLQSNSSLGSTILKNTNPVGTLSYIDPEYQRSGLISPKSDVYALGMVILQLVTSKPATGLSYLVETSIENGDFAAVVDPEAGNWPHEETEELAMLGLRCSELRRRDRPDLKDEVLPVLERLKEVAVRARDVAPSAPMAPNHFICPILKEFMDEPCVAADGYTYDRKAIERWLETNDKSPITDMPLGNKILIPNYTLLSAIMEWRSGPQ